jgi:hypothetical protein
MNKNQCNFELLNYFITLPIFMFFLNVQVKHYIIFKYYLSKIKVLENI